MIIATSAAVGIYQAKKRGTKYYMSIAADTRIANQTDKMFVMDSQDIGTKIFLVIFAVGILICLILVLMYVVMSWSYLSQLSNASRQRQRLQKEFNRILRAEMICAILFNVFPVVFVRLNHSLGLRMESQGVLLPSCFQSLLNSVLTLSLVTLYRQECKKIIMKLFPNNINIIYIIR
ncbi:hypothetical protein M3Y96_00590800 [Aphelenchoides besseyi]|nr:hypothetical protein M3Y96_00590800 [Aphelenchoides besseyi]